MTQNSNIATAAPIENTTKRRYRAKVAETEEVLETLAPEAQAGLRQFSLERMMGYGLTHSHAVQLRAGVLNGECWQQVAGDLADTAIGLAKRTDPPATNASKSIQYGRASALLRMSQALMLEDNEVRRDIVQRAVGLYEHAARLGWNRRHVRIETVNGPLAGWFIAAKGGLPIGSVVVIGGVEGWAMDFDSVGDALARRGLNALMLDAPGQGETRILHRHYLSPDWLASFRRAIDCLEEALPGHPIGVIGNSIGGSIALAVANNDNRIAACVNNGGIVKPSLGRLAGGTFFRKMMTFCGVTGEDEATAIWDTIEPCKPGSNTDYALLVVQGGNDPLVQDDHARFFMAQAPIKDKRMEWFSDGIHCIYNHLEDRDNLMADWMRAQLAKV